MIKLSEIRKMPLDKRIVQKGKMITNSGIFFDLYNPKPESISIGDIAHGLAYNGRWNGATNSFYSIAQHCCMVHDIVGSHDKFRGLMHDCEEAYWSDMIKPLKVMLEMYNPEVIKKMEALRVMIFEKYKVYDGNNGSNDDVKLVDLYCLHYEYEKYIEEKGKAWSPKRAKREWLKRAKRYINIKN